MEKSKSPIYTEKEVSIVVNNLLKQLSAAVETLSFVLTPTIPINKLVPSLVMELIKLKKYRMRPYNFYYQRNKSNQRMVIC